MHSFCFDPDASTQIYEYLSNESNSGCVRIYCPQCAGLPSQYILSRVNKVIDERILKLEERLEITLRTITERANERTYASAFTGNSETTTDTLLRLSNLKLIVLFNMKFPKQWKLRNVSVT